MIFNTALALSCAGSRTCMATLSSFHSPPTKSTHGYILPVLEYLLPGYEPSDRTRNIRPPQKTSKKFLWHRPTSQKDFN
ncbi:hypothetical protein B0H16DRAFT_347506 [Mycena metata]|uniref:Uncharacterized protein n=1 Tax=Mycena metata TaxID=1033252 RepID=A0AAD7HLI4_9AGAR|nr:hypothetical protein B0H16DRAFT_347506 [Mycena metata]